MGEADSQQQEGRKDDRDKLRYDLIPVRPLELVAEVYTIGARKYDDRNWEKGIKWGRIFAAMMRHAWKWWRGEQRDQVDGQHHLASVVWCALALMEYEETCPVFDDRPKGYTPPQPKRYEVGLTGGYGPGAVIELVRGAPTPPTYMVGPPPKDMDWDTYLDLARKIFENNQL